MSFHKRKSESTKSLPSQSVLAKKIGTTDDGSTSTGIADALNYYDGDFGDFSYVAADIEQSSDPFGLFKKRVTNEIINGTYAPIVLLETEYLDRYNGKELRHYNTISGWDSGDGTLRLADPNWNDKYYGVYWDEMGTKTRNGVFRAVYKADIHGSNKAMIY